PTRPPRTSTPFPYTTLFRSQDGGRRDRSDPQVPLHLRTHLRSEAGQGKRDGRAQPVVHAVEHEHVRRAAGGAHVRERAVPREAEDRKSTRLNSSHVSISYAV